MIRNTDTKRDAVGRPMEILLIEDDFEDAGMTFEALRQGDVPCRISLVRDGEEAMEFLLRRQRFARAPQPDLILLDLNLPKKSGREVLAEVKADQRLAAVPVVVLTSSPTQQSVLQAEGLHVESYLVKPVDRGHFVNTVKSLRKYILSDVILPQ
ncbi:MAG: response regulator [Thermoguttaceae bacterium]|jgi:CheY-like chemotaxis protein